MNYYDPSLLNWIASPHDKRNAVPNKMPTALLLDDPFTATSGLLIFNIIKDDLYQENQSDDKLGQFLMSHSQQTFSEIWEDPEENIWDEL